VYQQRGVGRCLTFILKITSKLKAVEDNVLKLTLDRCVIGFPGNTICANFEENDRYTDQRVGGEI